MTNPVVSVIMIFHDSLRFMREAVESLRAQSFTDWELVLVDDGSTDGSTELAREIVANGLSVRQSEMRAKQAKPGRIETKSALAPRGVDADLEALQRQLGDMLGLRVKVAHGARGGTVTLNYSSLDQLDLICQRLSGERI